MCFVVNVIVFSDWLLGFHTESPPYHHSGVHQFSAIVRPHRVKQLRREDELLCKSHRKRRCSS